MNVFLSFFDFKVAVTHIMIITFSTWALNPPKVEILRSNTKHWPSTGESLVNISRAQPG